MKLGLSLILAICAIAALVIPTQASSFAPTTASTSVAAVMVPAAELDQTLSASPILTDTPHMTGAVRIATLIATYFDRDVEEILALHAEEIGFGSIAKALYTAVEAGVPLETILEMRLADIGWGDIRQSFGLHPGMPHASLGQIISQGKGQIGPDWLPPGQRKKMEGSGYGGLPPGQAKKMQGSNGGTPPGQAKKGEKADQGKGKP